MPERVAVVRALRGLGDLLCLVPALRALRGALPHARLTLVGLPEARWLRDRFPAYLDELMGFPGYPGIREREVDVRRLPAFFAEAQRRDFDLALQLHGSGIDTNPFTVMLGARHTAGFFVPGRWRPDPARFLPWEDAEPEPRRPLRLLAALGIPNQGDHLEFPIRDDDRAALASIPGVSGLPPRGYACIHPGAHDPMRRWPPERFGAVADALAAGGLRVVLTGGVDERPLTAAVAAAMRAPALDLAGRTDLGGLAALLAGARLLVCNDTGVSHLAAALRVPSVVVFLASDPARWAPLDRERHRAVGCGSAAPAACAGAARGDVEVGAERSTLYAGEPDEERLWADVPVSEVLSAAAALLELEKGRAHAH